MYQVHDWSEVRRLDREGLSKRAIARRLAMSRTTVYRLLALSGPPAYEREPAASLLDPFKGSVLAMLREDASVPATVIREHLQRSGYAGGITILKGSHADAEKVVANDAGYLLDTVKGSDLGSVDGKLVLDFNFSYNPSCAYDPRWVCPLAPPGNRLVAPIRAGEQYPMR